MKLPSGPTFDEKLASIFEPDQLLAIQFFDTYRRKTHLQPEKVLMFAVLKDAVTCIEKYAGSSRGRGRRLFGETRDWILLEDEDWPFSFNNICTALGLDPGYLRRALVQMMEKESARTRVSKALKPEQAGKRKPKERRMLRDAA